MMAFRNCLLGLFFEVGQPTISGYPVWTCKGSKTKIEVTSLTIAHQAGIEYSIDIQTTTSAISF